MATRLNLNELPSKPVSLPVFNLPPLDLESEIREAAAKVAERRVIRAGLDAWQAIGKAESFAAWAAIGKALAIGKAHALRTVDTNAPWWQRRYGYRFNEWLKTNGFFSGMTPSVRSVAIELYENLPAIEAWRATLSEKQRRSLIHPLSNVRRWKAATMPEGKSLTHLRGDARAALKHFLTCLRKLPAGEASMLIDEMLAQRTVIADAA
jgi:hypothetical protein